MTVSTLSAIEFDRILPGIKEDGQCPCGAPSVRNAIISWKCPFSHPMSDVVPGGKIVFLQQHWHQQGYPYCAPCTFTVDGGHAFVGDQW